MDDLDLLIDFFAPLDRLGPGCAETTRNLIQQTGLSGRAGLSVADLGCGTGASAVVLAQALDAQVTAVDLFEPLLRRVEARARAASVGDRVKTLAASMDALPLPPESLDLVWSEAAAYSVGFETAVSAWQSLLRAGGVLVVSELVWRSSAAPDDLVAHFAEDYPQMTTAPERSRQLAAAGYTVVHQQWVTQAGWRAYFEPVLERTSSFVAAHEGSAEAVALAEAMKREATLCLRSLDHIGYRFFVAKRA